MTNDEKRLKVLNRLLIIKIIRKEEKRFSNRTYFKFRKWHPIILFLLIWKVLYRGFQETYIFAKDLIDELNEEDFIEIMKDDKEEKN